MKKIILGFIAIGFLAVVGCEKQRGCTDPNAINFDSAAEENDGSCIYEEDNNSNTDQDSTGTNNGGTDTTNNGSSSGEAKTCQEIEFTWNDVTNPTTGRTWMDRNLGASQVAESSTDSLAYGDLYQWGRGSDGHQCRNSATTDGLSDSDSVGHGDFLIISTFQDDSPYDWRSPQNDSLWQGVDGINNPCPSGYRLPTETEWEEEVESWTSQNAFGSVLKLPMAGIRHNSGSLSNVGTGGYYWSSTVSGAGARYLIFGSSDAGMNPSLRAYGSSVRCIKD